jgi:16S rRNA (adenine1518-N6/adenine1519-N6)-dimethyltransferase
MENEVRFLLKKYKLQPLKKWGQNFLVSKKTYDKIIMEADLSPEEIIVEIGAGLGILTKKLAQGAKKVLALENDSRLVNLLKQELRNFQNVKIIEADILKIKLTQLRVNNLGYKVVANLPYNIASAVIRKFLTEKPKPQKMVLMVQKEVGERICAKPPRMSKLGLFSQVFANTEIVSFVPKGAFFPPPKVASAVVKITLYKKPLLEERLIPKLEKIARAGFSQPRKQLVNNLSVGLKLNKAVTAKLLASAGISPQKRAENLSLKEWIKLTKKAVADKLV